MFECLCFSLYAHSTQGNKVFRAGADHSLHDGHSGRPEWYMDCWDLHNNVAKTRKDLIINTIDMNVIDLMLCTELRVRHTKCSIIIKSVKKPVCKG